MAEFQTELSAVEEELDLVVREYKKALTEKKMEAIRKSLEDHA